MPIHGHYRRSQQTICHNSYRCNDNFQQQNTEVVNNEFALECLRSHNHCRAQHGCPPLHLSDEISQFSQKWAEQISKMEHLYHSYHPQYGENLFVTYLTDNSLPMTEASEVVESWYSEHRFYPLSGYITRETALKVGHFTQVVWSNSKELGIGKSVSKSNRMYVVANYFPAGNIMKKFSVNVPKKLFNTSCEKHHYSQRMLTKATGFCQEFCFESWTEY